MIEQANERLNHVVLRGREIVEGVAPVAWYAAAWGFALGLLLFSMISYQITGHPLYLLASGVGVAAVGIWALAMAYTMPQPTNQTNQPTGDVYDGNNPNNPRPEAG
jgi:CHASE2 domain-containing sensor protein